MGFEMLSVPCLFLFGGICYRPTQHTCNRRWHRRGADLAQSTLSQLPPNTLPFHSPLCLHLPPTSPTHTHAHNKAAKMGLPSAHLCCGKAYMTGKGVSSSYQLAHASLQVLTAGRTYMRTKSSYSIKIKFCENVLCTLTHSPLATATTIRSPRGMALWGPRTRYGSSKSTRESVR